MPAPVKPSKRPYHSPHRAAAAAATREAILRAAKTRFEARGWTGTSIPAIAADAGISPKTIEAQLATKAALLADVVDYAIRGDDADIPMVRRELALAVEAAPDAATMLERHAAHSCAIAARSAPIAWVVESAAASDEHVAKLWARMTENWRYGGHWAAKLALQKPGIRTDLTLNETEQIFLIAMDWSTYRTLTTKLALTPEGAQAWILRYYQHMLLA